MKIDSIGELDHFRQVMQEANLSTENIVIKSDRIYKDICTFLECGGNSKKRISEFEKVSYLGIEVEPKTKTKTKTT